MDVSDDARMRGGVVRRRHEANGGDSGGPSGVSHRAVQLRRYGRWRGCAPWDVQHHDRLLLCAGPALTSISSANAAETGGASLTISGRLGFLGIKLMLVLCGLTQGHRLLSHVFGNRPRRLRQLKRMSKASSVFKEGRSGPAGRGSSDSSPVKLVAFATTVATRQAPSEGSGHTARVDCRW